MVFIIFCIILLCLQRLQEAYGIQFLLEMDKSISIINTENKTREFLVRNISTLLSWDYHYDKGYLYYVEQRPDHLYVGDLKRLNFKDKSVVAMPFSSENDGELEVEVDWVRDEIYVVTGKDSIMKANLDGQNRRVVLSIENVKASFYSPFAEVTPRTAAFTIEPYEGLMYMTYNSTLPSDKEIKHVIMKGYLNGVGLKVYDSYIYNIFANTVLDETAKWVYIVRDSETHVFPYETAHTRQIGAFKLSWDDVEPSRLCDAYQNNFYMAYAVGNDVHVYEYPNDPSRKWKEIFDSKRRLARYKSKYNAWEFCKISTPRIGCIGVGLKLYGLLRQRPQHDGAFECNRVDCEYQCAVRLDTGDTCTCPVNQFLTTDNKTCEDAVCKIPDPLSHRVFTRYPCPGGPACGLEPGTSVNHADLVTVSCEPGYYTVQGDSFSSDSTLTTCNFRDWFPRIPSCTKLCPALKSLTVTFTCYQGPRVVSCENPMLPGTVVEFSCKEYHDSNEKNHANGLTCTSSGEWSRPIPYCTPNCGKSNLNSHILQPVILGELFSEMGNFPWHAGLYHKRNGTWEAVCGATLITPKVILTAAHCVTVQCFGCKATPMSHQDVMVALGKLNRSWNSTEKSQVRKALTEIRVHKDYVGSAVNYGQDIAILVMESIVEVNNFVMPACVDFSRNHVKKFQEDRTLRGYVAGWGNTEECSSFGNVCGSVSETLKYTNTTVIFFNECFARSQMLTDHRLKSHSRLTTDKLCAGDGKESVVQKGDSGGGLTFVFDGLHYVFGVVSLKLKLEIGDRTSYSFGAFTNVENYLDWLKLQFYNI